MNFLLMLLEEEEEAARRRKIILLSMFNLLLGFAASTLSTGSIATHQIFSEEGQDYIKRLLDPSLSNQVYNCRKIYRMSQHVFLKFCNLMRKEGVIRNDQNITVEEKFAQFLVMVGQNQSYEVARERFQHSDSVTYFNEILNAILRLSGILLVKPSSSTPDKIRNDPTVFPYFKDCIGAIDGTHVKATIFGKEKARFRNKKGELTQNIMGACNFNMEFVYILAGWEGSATNTQVLQNALSRPNGFQVSSGKFYLADIGYLNLPEFICPFRGIRYHLTEYDINGSPTNAMENFNYRHSQLREVIERTFKVVKHRFSILRGYMPFSFEIQVKIVLACCLLHNFIRKVDATDLFEDFQDELEEAEICDQLEVPEREEISITIGRSQKRMKKIANRMRENIMTSMWEG